MPLFATHQIRKMKGGAQSHLMLASDGLPYIVKFQNNPQSLRVLANEFIGCRIAGAMGLNVPPHAVIEVPQVLIDTTGELLMECGHTLVPCRAGLQFGSQLVGGSMPGRTVDYLPDLYLARVGNLIEFAGALVFDKWTCNMDGRQAVFERAGSSKQYRAAFIDQGFCFGAESWTFRDAPLRGAYARRSVYHNITGWEFLDPWLERMYRLDEQAIWNLLADLPAEWIDGSVSELESLVKRLCARKHRVRELIADFRDSTANPFPHWRHSVHLPIAASPTRMLIFEAR